MFAPLNELGVQQILKMGQVQTVEARAFPISRELTCCGVFPRTENVSASGVGREPRSFAQRTSLPKLKDYGAITHSQMFYGVSPSIGDVEGKGCGPGPCSLGLDVLTDASTLVVPCEGLVACRKRSLTAPMNLGRWILQMLQTRLSTRQGSSCRQCTTTDTSVGLHSDLL